MEQSFAGSLKPRLWEVLGSMERCAYRAKTFQTSSLFESSPLPAIPDVVVPTGSVSSPLTRTAQTHLSSNAFCCFHLKGGMTKSMFHAVPRPCAWHEPAPPLLKRLLYIKHFAFCSPNEHHLRSLKLHSRVFSPPPETCLPHSRRDSSLQNPVLPGPAVPVGH